GLGYTLGLTAYVPWRPSAGGGLELDARVPEGLTVGRAADVALTAAFPAGASAALRLGLPAGVQPETPSLDALVSAGTITRYETEDGAVTLHLPLGSAGDTWRGALRVIPTLAGTLQAPPASLAVDGQPQTRRQFAPKPWVIR
ncbi:MAG: hypothetical protein INH37_06085, partial [Myxococcaceae bacterium]|nr:hypothetical protein [Myxococcaceae bacterium]